MIVLLSFTAGKDITFGVEMKNYQNRLLVEVSSKNIGCVPPYVHFNKTPLETHDSDRLYTTEVKNHGESLLIVLQKAALYLAEPSLTVRVPRSKVASLPFGKTPKKLQDSSFHSYTMSP